MRIYHPDGKPNLGCIIDRLLSSRHEPTIIIATSTDQSDEPIVQYVRKNYIAASTLGTEIGPIFLYRGSLGNVVERFNGALNRYAPDATHIWRVMGDCPLLDVSLNDWRTDVLHRTGADSILVNSPEPTYAAMGSVWSRRAWDVCAKMSSGSLLEHPGELIWQNQSDFKIIRDPGPDNIYYQPIRTELDTEADLEFFRQVYSEYPKATAQEWVDTNSRTTYAYEGDYTYNTKSVLTWLSSRPDIVKINAHVEEKTHSTYLHGHHRAKRFICKNCLSTIGWKFNDKLALKCGTCGETRDYY